METRVFFDQIRGNLLEKRHNLVGWLRSAPPEERRIRLGPNDPRAVQTTLQVLDNAIAQAEDQTLGMCEVCHDHVNPELLLMDYTSCVCLDHYSEAERRQLEWELELSQVVQRALLPQALPDIPGFALAAFSRPAQIVGGDYFDFFRFGDGSYGMAVADVAGHGMAASMLMASVQTVVHTLAPLSQTPAEVVQHLNRFFNHNVHFTTFITLFLARLDPDNLTITYCNAGHNPPLLAQNRNGSGTSAAWLNPTGAAIGLIEDFQIGTETITLSPGDLMLVYTDGVTEATNAHNEEFGPERLEAFVRQHAHMPAQELVAGLRRDVQEFTGGRPLADDATIVACRAAPGP